MIENTSAKLVLANRAHDTSKILSYFNKQNTEPVTPLKYNSLYQRDHERKLYYFCYIIKNSFLALKHWYDMVIRYIKTFDALITSVFIHCVFMLF